MVPKDVIAWRKLRASAWKLISGLSSGVILREESLEWQKLSFKPIIIQDIFIVYIDIFVVSNDCRLFGDSQGDLNHYITSVDYLDM